jgi:AcrR family transcriptional regulator
MYIVQFKDTSMPSITRQERRRQQTRDRIAQVAFALFETHGYDAVTMDHIASAADVARGTLYNHFAVKEAVLAHWMHAQLKIDLAPLVVEVMRKNSFNGRIATLLEASAAWWEQHRRYLAPYIRYRFQGVGQVQRDEEPTSGLVMAYTMLIERGQQDGEIRQNASAPRLAHYLHFLYFSALMRWVDDGDLSLADEFADVLEFFNEGAMEVR